MQVLCTNFFFFFLPDTQTVILDSKESYWSNGSNNGDDIVDKSISLENAP